MANSWTLIHHRGIEFWGEPFSLRMGCSEVTICDLCKPLGQVSMCGVCAKGPKTARLCGLTGRAKPWFQEVLFPTCYFYFPNFLFLGGRKRIPWFGDFHEGFFLGYRANKRSCLSAIERTSPNLWMITGDGSRSTNHPQVLWPGFGIKSDPFCIHVISHM